MKVTLLFFATLRDHVGAKSIELAIPHGTTVAALRSLVIEKYPALAPLQDTLMVAINRVYADDDTAIPDKAEIAFLPPVSGG